MRRSTDVRAGVLVMAVMVVVAPGCTTGWIRYLPLDADSPSSRRSSPGTPSVNAMDCQDYQSGDQPLLYPYVRRKILYITTCTRDGAGIPWKVLGAFGAGSVAFNKWDVYSRDVVEKARAQGCPAVLVRRAPPTSGQEAHGIGALCVDMSRPSGIHGPLRLAAYSEEQPRILADGDPGPTN